MGEKECNFAYSGDGIVVVVVEVVGKTKVGDPMEPGSWSEVEEVEEKEENESEEDGDTEDEGSVESEFG